MEKDVREMFLFWSGCVGSLKEFSKMIGEHVDICRHLWSGEWLALWDVQLVVSFSKKTAQVSILFTYICMVRLFAHSTTLNDYQQNVFWSLGASGSVWELSDGNPRVFKSWSVLDWCSGLQVHLGAPGSASDKSGSADQKPRNTQERQQQAWQCRPQVWMHIEPL